MLPLCHMVLLSPAPVVQPPAACVARSRIPVCQEDSEAKKNPLTKLLGTLLPKEDETDSTPAAIQAPKSPVEDVDLATKSVWYATEAFGNIAAALRPPPPPPSETEMGSPRDLTEATRRLEADYEGTPEDPRPYFLTGRMDVALYDEDCEFADPFVSFRGRDRFVANLENLSGGFITESSTRVLSSETATGDAASGVPPTFTTKLLVKLRLGLPWEPVLAWPWGVTHVFDPDTGLIVRHLESWDVGAQEGVRQLLTGGKGKTI